jgi:hypothetical protein
MINNEGNAVMKAKRVTSQDLAGGINNFISNCLYKQELESLQDGKRCVFCR